jgi:hypothetical protein
MKNKYMHPIWSVCVLLLSVSSLQASPSIDRLIEYYLREFGHEHPDDLMKVELDFAGNGSPVVLLSFSKTNNESRAGYTWRVFQLSGGQWIEPKTFGTDGSIKNFGALQFMPEQACFAYVPSYKCNGVIARFPGKVWSFSYFIGSAINTTYFWSASELGLSEVDLDNLMSSKVITVDRQIVP